MAIQAISKSVVRSKIVMKPLLLSSPVEELGGQNGVGIAPLRGLENLRHKFRCNTAELVEFGDHRRAPLVLILPKGVDDEASNWGKADGAGEECLGGGRRRVGVFRWAIRIPVAKIEGLGIWGNGLVGVGRREGLAVGEEAAVDGGAVLLGVAVAVAVVEV